nr:hypothetical protein CFP56_73378 [Quercus suber]
MADIWYEHVCAWICAWNEIYSSHNDRFSSRHDIHISLFSELRYSYTAALCNSYCAGKTQLHGTTILASKSYP